VSTAVVFEIPAKADLAEVKLWLKDKRLGLAVDFTICLEETVERIRRHPEGYPVVSRRLRRAVLRRFPYGVYYWYDAPIVRIIGVIHSSRHPRTWLERNH
jgi:toxin ParE1/3/4